LPLWPPITLNKDLENGSFRFKTIDDCSDLNRFSIAAALQLPLYCAMSIPNDWRLTDMIVDGTKDSAPSYSVWFGKPVVLLVVIRQCHVPMPCLIVGESASDVRVRVQSGWEMDIRKDLILAVEEVVNTAENRVN
jgi:hypothetical protein